MNSIHQKMRTIGVAITLMLCSTAGSRAETASAPPEHLAHPGMPSAVAVVKRMNDALTPHQTLLGRVFLAAETADKTVTHYSVLCARRSVESGTQTTILFLGSDDPGAEGSVMAWGSQRDGEPSEAFYLPYENRVREVVPVLADAKLLRTDFTRGDLDLVTRETKAHRLLGRDTVGHREAYKLETEFADSTYYSRMVTWVSPSSWLPMHREYYDRANRLWKVERYQGVVIDGHPTVIGITIDDVQSRTSSDLVFESLRYVEQPLDELFETATLNKVPGNPAWADLGDTAQ